MFCGAVRGVLIQPGVQLTAGEIRKVAALARLTLTEDEVVRMTADIARILDYVAKLDELFTRLLQRAAQHPAKAQALLEELFAAMATGGEVAYEDVDWFNGGLFSAAAALPLAPDDIRQLLTLADLDWSAIDPTISGTLFVRGLDPAQRAQFGAQFTDPPTILRLINPVVLDPLRTR